MSGLPPAVLFDLDGTLVDSAPDLAGAANDLREAEGLVRLPLERFRPMVGAGARGMIAVGFGLSPGDDDFIRLRDDFLGRYATRLARETKVFTGMRVVLDELDRARRPWGIVTNKATRFAEPLLRALDLDRRAAAVVCGDTTPFSKPRPEPLLEAARRLTRPPQECLYVGDDLRDIQAGRAANMGTVAAAWGYLGNGDLIEAWQADYLVQTPEELLKLLALA
jgi:phosphoglycolate phosphatase